MIRYYLQWSKMPIYWRSGHQDPGHYLFLLIAQL
jgi:hypothetical protein